MRNLVASTYVTLDGAFEEPSCPRPTGPTTRNTSPAISSGRATPCCWDARPNEGFAAAWPTDEWIEREGEFAERMNGSPKYVASRTLSEPLEWNNSHLLDGDVPGAVRKLKEESGRDILLYSSVALMRDLMKQDLVDRFRIWVHPLVLGEGARLFAEGDEAKLELVDATTLPHGIVVLDYRAAA